jgi:hypothetical protein
METKKSLKKSPVFSCKFCDYYTCKKCDFDKHVSTRKHELMVSLETMETKKSQKVAQLNECAKCNVKKNIILARGYGSILKYVTIYLNHTIYHVKIAKTWN